MRKAVRRGGQEENGAKNCGEQALHILILQNSAKKAHGRKDSRIEEKFQFIQLF
jgi:hypothetical protein